MASSMRQQYYYPQQQPPQQIPFQSMPETVSDDMLRSSRLTPYHLSFAACVLALVLLTPDMLDNNIAESMRFALLTEMREMKEAREKADAAKQKQNQQGNAKEPQEKGK